MKPDAELEREARALARYLAGVELDSVAIRHYLRWHATSGARADRVDRLLLRVASAGKPGLALADAYCARWRRGALLRRKLVLVLALIETSAPGFEMVDRTLSASAAQFWVRMVGRGLAQVLLTALAGLAIGPVHLLCAALGPRERRA